VSEAIRTDLEIRTANTDDAALLAEFGARTFTEAFGTANTPENLASYIASSFSPQIQNSELQDPDSLFLIASFGEATAGYARLRVSSPPACVPASKPVELERFYVDSRWHGRGTSHALMKEVLRRSVLSGHDVIWLGVWEQNEGAIAFYRKWAFKVVGKKSFSLGSDLQTDYVMSLSLELIAIE